MRFGQAWNKVCLSKSIIIKARVDVVKDLPRVKVVGISGVHINDLLSGPIYQGFLCRTPRRHESKSDNDRTYQ